jgi:hypothetical protein
MKYTLLKRESKWFELYNDLESGDVVELAFLLKESDQPRRIGKEITTEHIWVTIDNVSYDSKHLYRAMLSVEPRYLKHARRGDVIGFSPENVLNVKRKKTKRRVKTIKDFTYRGVSEKKIQYKNLIRHETNTFAINPGVVILRTGEPIKGAVPRDTLDSKAREEFEEIIGQFNKVETEKYNVRINRSFIEKSGKTIRAEAKNKPVKERSVIIRISDRTFISFTLVKRLLSVFKEITLYLEFLEEWPMLYFKSGKQDGFISLTKQNRQSFIIDLTKLM